MASAPIFMFCIYWHIFGGAEGVGSRFHVLRSSTRFRRSCFHVLLSQTRLRRFRGRWVPFSCFVLPEFFSAVPRASSLVFMFCVPVLVFGGSECVGFGFQVLRARNHFRRFRGRWVPFSCFVSPDSFSAFLRASGPVFMFCVPVLVFGCTVVVGSRFHVLRSRTHFRRYRGSRDPFSCLALPD
jgi:hypothetical protein